MFKDLYTKWTPGVWKLSRNLSCSLLKQVDEFDNITFYWEATELSYGNVTHLLTRRLIYQLKELKYISTYRNSLIIWKGWVEESCQNY